MIFSIKQHINSLFENFGTNTADQFCGSCAGAVSFFSAAEILISPNNYGSVIRKLYKPVHHFSVRSSMKLNGEIRPQHALHLKSCR